MPEREPFADYYRQLLHNVWGSMSPRDRKRVKRKHLMLYLALSGAYRHGGLK